MVAMAELREMIAALGFSDVKTLLQSGNVVFRGPAKATAKLEAQLEAALEKRFGMHVDFTCGPRTSGAPSSPRTRSRPRRRRIPATCS